jgi:hypothetical protein
MNKITNDRGHCVIAIGQKGSKERAACEYPSLIDTYRRRHYVSCTDYLSLPYSYVEANDDLEKIDDIKCPVERKAILANTDIAYPD